MIDLRFFIYLLFLGGVCVCVCVRGHVYYGACVEVRGWLCGVGSPPLPSQESQGLNSGHIWQLSHLTGL